MPKQGSDCVEHMIYCQKDIPKDKLRYGFRTSASTGCGWISVYNAMRIMGYKPNAEIVAKAEEYAQKNNSTITITSDVKSAVSGADVIYTDVWVSMGDEAESEKRRVDFKEYQVNQELIDLADDDVIFMHCLPAIRGEEVSAEVIDGPHSVVYDQAENRMHAQKGVLYYFLKELQNQ